jgi:hypothetical protein
MSLQKQIQVFDHNKIHLFTIPLSYPLEEYERLIETMRNSSQAEADRAATADLDADGPEEQLREGWVLNAEFISVIIEGRKYGFGDTMPDDIRQRINVCVMSSFFGQCYDEFVTRTNDGFVGQLMVPATPRERPRIAWVKLSLGLSQSPEIEE